MYTHGYPYLCVLHMCPYIWSDYVANGSPIHTYIPKSPHNRWLCVVYRQGRLAANEQSQQPISSHGLVAIMTHVRCMEGRFTNALIPITDNLSAPADTLKPDKHCADPAQNDLAYVQLLTSNHLANLKAPKSLRPFEALSHHSLSTAVRP